MGLVRSKKLGKIKGKIEIMMGDNSEQAHYFFHLAEHLRTC